jgi:lysophospholipase L1-like esterase
MNTQPSEADTISLLPGNTSKVFAFSHAGDHACHVISIRLPLVPALLLALTGIACASDLTLTWPTPTPPPGATRATFPVPHLDWFARFETNLDKLKSGPYDLILDGDSITDFWQTTGQDVFKTRFGSIKSADFAISGDQVQHVLWRLQHGELEGQNPKLIMLMIGTNNRGEDPKEIADGIKLLLNEYETRCPNAHILLLGVFPRGAAANNPDRDWISKINAIISTYEDGKRVTYLDFGAKFLQPDGTLTPDIMPDFLHPSAKGYVIWADAIQPVIEKYFPNAAAPAPAK